METSTVIAIFIAIAAIASAVAAFFAWRTAKRTTLHHILEDIRKDYRSPEMHHAIKRLWQLYEDVNYNKAELVERYEQIYHEDKERISRLDEHQQIEAERSTLHYQRRLVSHFYQYVGALYADKILPRGIFVKTWGEEDLRIIPNIIIPIEIKLHEIARTPPLQPVEEHNLSYSLLVLHRLYRDSKDS